MTTKALHDDLTHRQHHEGREDFGPAYELSFAEVGTILLLSFLLPLLLAGVARAQPAELGAPETLPGDSVLAPAMADQRHADVAAGGDGFLVVWAEERASLIGLNLTDLYAARLDSAGSLVDEEPILLSTAEHMQWPPRVAWSGSAWLVVYRNERPTDFYLEEDVVALRVSASGQLLDSEPIVIASDVADEAGDPDVAAAAGGWAVVWPQFDDEGIRGVRGARITHDGMVLDPDGVPIWYDQHNSYAVNPRVEWNGSHHLVTWTRSNHDLVGLRLDASLQAVEAAPFSIGLGLDQEMATDGTDFYVVFVHTVNVNQSEVRGTRVSAAGQVLDAPGVPLSSQLFVSDFSPTVAWNGFGWTTVFADDGTGILTFDFDLALRRVGTDGQPAGDAPLPVDAGETHPVQAQAVSRPGGVQLIWQREPAEGLTFDIVARQSSPVEGFGAETAVSVGLPRQLESYVAEAGPGGHRLLVFRSEISGRARILGHLLDASGEPVNDEPAMLAEGQESGLWRPQAAGTDDVWLVVWEADDGVFGRRFDASLQPLDAAPQLLLDNREEPAVAALGDTFLVAGCEMHFFHEPQRWLTVARVGSDGTLLDAEPPLVAAGFEKSPRMTSLDGRWLLVWESQTRHDSSASTADLAWIGADGAIQSVETVSDAGYGDAPDVAAASDGSRALVVWHDNADFGNADLEGRFVEADGTTSAARVLIAEPQGQVAPRVDAHVDDQGASWLVTWLDGRQLQDLSEARPDVWAARLDAAGTVLDVGGFPVALSPRYETDAEVASFLGRSLLLYSAHPGESPAGHRVVAKPLATGPEPLIFADGFEDGTMANWSTSHF